MNTEKALGTSLKFDTVENIKAWFLSNKTWWTS